jgi:hypothetical protein
MNHAYARTVAKKKKFDPFVTDNDVKLDRAKPVQRFTSVAEKVARSSIYTTNWYYPGSQKDFPYHERLKRIDRYFPYAEGGPLLVDEPMDEAELALCERKRPKLKERGFRYVILGLGSTFEDALFQLGEL